MKDKTIKFLGYEVSAWVGVLEAALALAVAFGVGGLTNHTVGIIMGAVTAGVGLVVAFLHENATVAALVGFGKGLLSVGVAYGLTLTDVQTSAIIAFITVIGGMFLRTQTKVKQPATPKH